MYCRWRSAISCSDAAFDVRRKSRSAAGALVSMAALSVSRQPVPGTARVPADADSGAVQTRTTLSEQIGEALASMSADLCCAYLFGSQARGRAGPASDIDLAILLANDPPPTLAGLQLDLADRLSAELGRQVDLVVLNRAPVDLIHRVLREGELVFERDRAARVRFEVRARNEYFDLLPHLQRYRRSERRPR
jgi:predicted nucleotidyltransferase